MRKTILFSGISMIIMLLQTMTSLAQEGRQVVASLEAGETIAYGENCFSLSAEQQSVFFVTRKDGKFYIHDKGQRQGPFDELSEGMLKSCGTAGMSDCAVYSPGDCSGDNGYDKYIKQEYSSMNIVFKGKSFGPYLAVTQFNITCDEASFSAIVMTMDTKYLLINSDGRSVPIPGMPSEMISAVDGSNALVKYIKGFDPSDPDFDPTKVDITMVMKPFVITLEGKEFGPYEAEQLGNENIYFCKSGGKHWFFHKDSEYFRDGVSFLKTPESVMPCDIWFNPDGKYAFKEYEGNETPGFGEAWRIKNPLEIVYYQKAGKTWLKWVSLENAKDLVVYNRAL